MRLRWLPRTTFPPLLPQDSGNVPHKLKASKKKKKMGENEVLYGLGCQVGGVNTLATLSDLPVGQLVSLPGICKHAY